MLLADNIVHFSRVLRDAGLAVGPDRVLAALAAVQAVGIDRRDDVHAALSAVMVARHDEQVLFDAAFDTFWRDPKLLQQMLHALLPKVSGRGERVPPPRPRRLADALAPPAPPKPTPPAAAADQPVEFEAAFTASERERLQRADFETMTRAEYDWAQRIARSLPPPVPRVRLRRHQRAPQHAAQGRIDLRRTLQAMARAPHALLPQFTQPVVDWPPIVVLLDISGSMASYARLFLHYVHGVMRRHLRVQVFTFGTRLTCITRCLRHRDPDVALQAADAQVPDWRGGTRIAAALRDFNRRWARRVLGANAAVLLVSDGLDRDEHGGLSAAAAQLHRLAHQVVWLNPLLRFDGFEPRAAGVRALLPHVDRFLPVHNLASLADLATALRTPARPPAHWLQRPPARPPIRPPARPLARPMAAHFSS